jgi:hypothetical protein
LAELEARDALWQTYGADPADFSRVASAVEAAGGEVGMAAADGLVSSAESRTVWAVLDPAAFEELLGQKLLAFGADEDGGGSFFWNGTLDPGELPIEGIAFRPELVPAVEPLTDWRVELDQGPQSIGNGADETTALVLPTSVAEFYGFPLTGREEVTSTVGLVAPNLGAAVPGNRDLQDGLRAFLAQNGLPAQTEIYEVTDEDGTTFVEENSGERSLDVGVTGTINPHSRIGLYASYSTFASLQLAVFDEKDDPGVLSSSFSDPQRPAPDSPFAVAWAGLLEDAALAGRSVFLASGDGGLGNETLNGLPNVDYTQASPYAVTVGGTSISLLRQAGEDATLADLLGSYEEGDRETLWALIAGGLKVAPEDSDETTFLLETAWNGYELADDVLPAYLENVTTTGGVDQRQSVPPYQQALGLSPTVAGSEGETGRGLPDVAALAAGNTFYEVPSGDFSTIAASGGTSASAPLWAALFQQVETIFEAQGLPRPGYIVDLLYQAAVISPAAFNDVRYGNNISSAYEGSDYVVSVPGTNRATDIAVSGFGYEAGPGHDLVAGLGTPNAPLLVDALLDIAHAELHSNAPAVLVEEGGGLVAGADSVLSLQSDGNGGGRWNVETESTTRGVGRAEAEEFAWTARLAQQSLQEDFSAELVRTFDGAGQGRIAQIGVAEGEAVSASFAGKEAEAPGAGFSQGYGFVDFASEDASLRVARPVAVAETENGRDGQDFTVSLRQNGTYDLAIQLYEVDDLEGTIDGIAPGERGYGAAVQAAAYRTSEGADRVAGPGYGEFDSFVFTGADAGDLIALRLFVEEGRGRTYYGFAEENPDGQTHLWNYGHNIWGFEDQEGGGDRDFNDLIVGLSFIDYRDDFL